MVTVPATADISPSYSTGPQRAANPKDTPKERSGPEKPEGWIWQLGKLTKMSSSEMDTWSNEGECNFDLMDQILILVYQAIEFNGFAPRQKCSVGRNNGSRN